MIDFIELILAVLTVIAFSLSIKNKNRYDSLFIEFKDLRTYVKALASYIEPKNINIHSDEVKNKNYSDDWDLARSKKDNTVATSSTISNLITNSTAPANINIINETEDEIYFAEKIKVSEDHKTENDSFEKQFGTKLPVWVGGIALALAGFFLVKYSIDSGLLSPAVRVFLGLVFGVCLVSLGNFIDKITVVNKKIAQALVGAGIADLYFSIYAATEFYNLVTNEVGFVSMALVTVSAVILSLKQGAPIALLGLTGGFLTPALIGSDNPQASILFIYLYFVVAGIIFTSRKLGLWFLSVIAIVLSYIWVLIWATGAYFSPADSMWLILFLVGVSITAIINCRKAYDIIIEDCNELFDEDITSFYKMTSAVEYIAIAGATILAGIITSLGGFTAIDWAMMGLISVAGIVLAYFDQKNYSLIPCVSMAVTAVMLISWKFVDPAEYMLILIMFGSLYTISGSLLRDRSENPLIWAGISTTSLLGFFLIAYFKLQNPMLDNNSMPGFWGLFAGLLAVGVFIELLKIFDDESEYRENLLAMYCVALNALVMLAVTIELDREFLSVAFASQVLALAYLDSKFKIKALRYIAMVLTALFGLILLPQAALLLQLTMYSLVEARLQLQNSIPIVNWPIFQLGVPAAFFIASSYLFREKFDDKFVKTLEVLAISLVGVMGYYLTRHAFHIDENILFVKATFIERGVITNILLTYGIACLIAGKQFSRNSILNCAKVLISVAMFRVVYFDLMIYNPIWSAQSVGELTIINGLLLNYGLPIALLIYASKNLEQDSNLQKITNVMCFVLAFAFINLNIRQFFHGSIMNDNTSGNAEIYSYSIAWLVYGIILLVIGTARENKTIRIASLAVIILAVGKVFLYDASELTGLYRVLSFFVLGIILMGLSWFYTKYIFNNSLIKSKI